MLFDAGNLVFPSSQFRKKDDAVARLASKDPRKLVDEVLVVGRKGRTGNVREKETLHGFCEKNFNRAFLVFRADDF